MRMKRKISGDKSEQLQPRKEGEGGGGGERERERGFSK